MKVASLSFLVALAVTACGSSLKAPTIQGEPPEYVEPAKSASVDPPTAPPTPPPPGADDPVTPRDAGSP